MKITDLCTLKADVLHLSYAQNEKNNPAMHSSIYLVKFIFN